jgi:hypothetical protein
MARDSLILSDATTLHLQLSTLKITIYLFIKTLFHVGKNTLQPRAEELVPFI